MRYLILILTLSFGFQALAASNEVKQINKFIADSTAKYGISDAFNGDTLDDQRESVFARGISLLSSMLKRPITDPELGKSVLRLAIWVTPYDNGVDGFEGTASIYPSLMELIRSQKNCATYQRFESELLREGKISAGDDKVFHESFGIINEDGKIVSFCDKAGR